MTKALLDVQILRPAGWRVLRDTRLRALMDSPDAFTSDYRRERSWSEHRWRQRARTASWVVAAEHGVVIGIAGVVNGHPGEPAHVESIWVDPDHRNRGVPVPAGHRGRGRPSGRAYRSVVVGAGGQPARPARVRPSGPHLGR